MVKKNLNVNFNTKLKSKKNISCKGCKFDDAIINDGIMKEKNNNHDRKKKNNEKLNKKIDYLSKNYKFKKIDFGDKSNIKNKTLKIKS